MKQEFRKQLVILLMLFGFSVFVLPRIGDQKERIILDTNPFKHRRLVDAIRN